MTDPSADLWTTVPRLLAENRYCVLATADADGTPWATPVFFSARGEHELFWVSSPESRHSRNLAARPALGVTVFDSTVPVGGAEAVYAEATAAPCEPALDVLNAALPPGKALTADDLLPAGPLQTYRAVVSGWSVLVRGGDQRFDNVADARWPVVPPRRS